MYRHFSHWKGLFFGILSLGGLAVITSVAGYLAGTDAGIDKKKFEVLRIGVLDGTRLKVEAKCFRAHDEIARRIGVVLGQFHTLSNEMKSAYEKIKNNKKLTAYNRNMQLARIENRWKIKSEKYSVEMQKLRNLDNKLTNFIQNKLFQNIEILAKKAKIDIVVNKGSQTALYVFYNAKNIDITDIVVKRMDEVLPSVDLREFE